MIKINQLKLPVGHSQKDLEDKIRKTKKNFGVFNKKWTNLAIKINRKNRYFESNYKNSRKKWTFKTTGTKGSKRSIIKQRYYKNKKFTIYN